LLQIVLRAGERTVTSRVALAVRKAPPDLGVDLFNGTTGTLAADQRADFRFNGGIQQR
jgi:hypothetical protein